MNDFRITRGHSCVPCQHRKIRCNGQSPCAYCIKTGKDCVRPPPRSRGSPREGRLAKAPTAAAPPRPTSSAQSGLVVVNGEQRRYVEDNKLWTTLGNELQTNDVASVGSPSAASGSSPGRDDSSSSQTGVFFFGRQRVDNLAFLHPSAVQAFNLWQAFLSNVHPLTKILHAPSMQETILRAVSAPASMTRSTEALLFAIYLLSVVSMSDDDCQRVFGDPKEKLLDKYCHATEEALSRVDFLRSTDLEVFQAFVLYLLALRHLCDHSILWLLTGLATRMGQRMGLHRESALKGLPPFEAEMRRRVWWQAVILDGRAAQLTGVSVGQDNDLIGDTKQPVNVNDSDLVPSMGALPPSSTGVTDMVFCSVRYEIGVWMVQNRSLLGMTPPSDLRARFAKSIDDLEQVLQEKYLNGIDTNVPLNLLTTYLAQSAISQLRLSVHDPIHRPEQRTTNLSPDQLDVLFENSLRVIQFDILANSTPSLQRYTWHITNFFPFETFVLLLSTLPGRPPAPAAREQMVAVAWDVINQVYEHHPCFVTDASDPLYSALGDLALRSWGRWSAAVSAAGMEQPVEPGCVARLMAERGGGAQPTAVVPPPSDTPAGGAAAFGSVPAPLGSEGDFMQTTGGQQMLPMVDNLDGAQDWGFWQELLDNSARMGGDQQDPFAFTSWMGNSG